MRKPEFEHELILCIVNEGMAETVMDVAKEAGATGGTVIRARGTANKDAELFFKITIDPQKEIVMILISKELKEPMMRALYEKAGLKTPGQGIIFSLPVDNVAGLHKQIIPAEEKSTQEKKED